MRRTGQSAQFLAIAVAMLSVSLSVVAPAHAQFPRTRFDLNEAISVDKGDSQQVDTHLDSVKAFLAAGQWDEAVERLRLVTESDSGTLRAIGPGRYITVRQFCHAQVGALPSEALELYRQRVDPSAQKLYEEGMSRRDEALLSRVVEQFFCSTWGDDALLALGDMALERGNYTAARAHWERISPLLKTPDGRPIWLALRGLDIAGQWSKIEPLLTARQQSPAWVAYPDTDLDLAAVRSRLVLASIVEGALERAQLELDVFLRLHPGSQGKLAGREGGYAEKLAELLEAACQWPQPDPGADWPTFGGSPRRTAPAPRGFRIAASAWDEPIELGEPQQADARLAHNLNYGGRRVAEDFDGLLSYHPVVSGDLLLVCDETQIKAFNLHTGQPAWGQKDGTIFQQDTRGAFGAGRGFGPVGRLGVPRFTMTVYDGKLLARCGDPVTSSHNTPQPDGRSSYLVCLDLKADGRLLWKIEPDGERWAFEGAPLAEGDDVYVAMRRSDDNKPAAYLACFDLQSGNRKWRRRICAASTRAGSEYDEATHNLLTLAEGTLYYSTNLGAVAAVRAADGQILWLSVYQRAASGDLMRPAAHCYRDLTPCVFYQGMLLVAPQDSEEIFALDATTGQMLWASDLPYDAVHLLGVAGDNLIASGNRLWWLNVYSGKVVRRVPEGEMGGPRGYGRGMIAGNEVFWPTRDRIFIFDCHTAQPTQEPITLATFGASSGNLLLVDGYLLIAAADKLYAFSQFPRRREALQKSVTQHPDDPLPYVELAECEESLGNLEQATRLYRQAIERATESGHYDGPALQMRAGRRLFQLLYRRAEAAVPAAPELAVQLWHEAADAALTSADRLTSLVQAGETLEQMGQSERASAGYRAILEQPPLARLPLDVSADWKLEARQVLAQRLDTLKAGLTGSAQTDVRQPSATDLASDTGRSDAPRATAAREGAGTVRAQLPTSLLWEKSDIGLPLAARDATGHVSEEFCWLFDGEAVQCLELRGGNARWRLPAQGKLVWSAREGDTLFVAIGNDVLAVGAADGRLLWRRDGRDGHASLLEQFQTGSGCLYAVQASSSIVALDAATGRELWAAPGKRFFLAGRYVVVQRAEPLPGDEPPYGLAPGPLWKTVVLDATSGRELHEVAAAQSDWLRSPVLLDMDHVVTVTTSGWIEMLDLVGGSLVWARRYGERSPVAQPDVLVQDRAVLMLSGLAGVARLDPASGAELWRAPAEAALPEASQPDELAVADQRALYHVAAGQLRAVSQADGKLLWELSLARGGANTDRAWHVRHVGPYLVAFPTQADPAHAVRLVYIDPRAGTIVYRSRTFVGASPEVDAHFTSQHVLVALDQHMWVLKLNEAAGGAANKQE